MIFLHERWSGLVCPIKCTLNNQLGWRVKIITRGQTMLWTHWSKRLRRTHRRSRVGTGTWGLLPGRTCAHSRVWPCLSTVPSPPHVRSLWYLDSTGFPGTRRPAPLEQKKTDITRQKKLSVHKMHRLFLSRNARFVFFLNLKILWRKIDQFKKSSRTSCDQFNFSLEFETDVENDRNTESDEIQGPQTTSLSIDCRKNRSD